MMVYGELGAVPLDVDIKSRMLTSWERLCLFDNTRSLIPYIRLKKICMYANCKHNTDLLWGCWILLKSNTSMFSIESVKQSVKLRLKD